MEVSGDLAQQKRGGILQSASKRVRMIFSVMASPNRIDILRILNSKGPLTYSELKSLAGFKSKKESGKFAYHLRKLLRQSLVALNKSERRYTITNLGKLVLSLARQIEERSIIESGKMYVRTSHQSIEEFNSHKIIQCLVREANVPLELAQKITEEVENRIYKFQTTYLTSSLIREIVNSVLLEHGHEDYRHKLARLGLPVYDVYQRFSNVEGVHNGVEGLLFDGGKSILEEHLALNTLPKDVADSYLAGDIHISKPSLWSLVPDTLFVSMPELVEDGVDVHGKYLGVTRISTPKTIEDVTSSISLITSLLYKEASQEVVVNGLASLLQKYSKGTSTSAAADLEAKLVNSFATTSATPMYENSEGTVISFVVPLSSDTKIINTILNAYKKYVKSTPSPRIGIIINQDKAKISEFSDMLSQIISLGGLISISKNKTSMKGILRNATDSKNNNLTAINLQSLSVNLPRLAYESNKDETYFRARLALLMKPALDAMALRKKEISDLTRRGMNPILAKNTQYMQKGSSTLVVNLTGVNEAMMILGYEDNKESRSIIQKVLQTAMDVASKKGKEIREQITISLSDSEGSERFARLDGEKYGKMSIIQNAEGESYSEGIMINAADINDLTDKSSTIQDCNNVSKSINGGVLIQLKVPEEYSVSDTKKSIEKASDLLPSFTVTKKVPICGNCGIKDEKIKDKCPSCKSPYIITT